MLLLNKFNLMDYSLLFAVEFNPIYAQKNPHEFVTDSAGELVYPLRLSKLQIDDNNIWNARIKLDNQATKAKLSS